MSDSATELTAPVTPVGTTPVARRGTAPVSSTTALMKQKAEGWVEVLRCIALAVFVAIPFLGTFAQPFSGRIVWTMAVAVLPLFIVLVGYHRWRLICPLAFFSKLPAYFGCGGKRTIPVWLEKNYHFIPLAFFIFGLWVRLVAMNGDGQAIALFFVGIALMAFVAGAVYTGKTWCNYICPVSFIEKIYTEPHGLRETPNSQCPKCTACKKNCPDINQENGYWKELDNPAKKVAYLAFPGLVLGFYTYYYLQSGTWDYYFGGSWTDEPGVWRHAFLPGHDSATAGFYFRPEIPRAAASILTLLAFAAASLLIFTGVEALIRRIIKGGAPEADAQRVRHVLFSITGFTAFVCFYSFAGVPTLRLFHPAPHVFLIVIVLTASIYLARRIVRTQRVFGEETLARNIVKRWEWSEPAPGNLRDAFLIHTIRSKETQKSAERSLEIYKDAVRDALADGLITRNEVHLLEALRGQLQIKQADHDKIMAALADEERALLSDPTRQLSAEKRLQLDNYSKALGHYLEIAFAPGGKSDDALVENLRVEYRVTPEEHKAALEDILSGSRGIGARLSEAVASVERAAHTIAALENERSPAHDFLKDILKRRRERAVHLLAKSLSIKSEVRAELEAGLNANDTSLREKVIEQLRESVVPMLAERLRHAQRQAIAQEAALANLPEKLAERARSTDPYERALALYLTGQIGAAQESGILHHEKDEHAVVRDTVTRMKSTPRSSVP